MSRRSTPERLHAARREVTRQRLMGEGGLPDEAERLVLPSGSSRRRVTASSGTGGTGRRAGRRCSPSGASSAADLGLAINEISREASAGR